MRKVKDTDFLHISARIKSREHSLLNPTDITKMLGAESAEDAAKVVIDKGYTAFDAHSMADMEHAFKTETDNVMELLMPHIPQSEIVDIFKIKPDYHNIKTILKADAMGVSTDNMLDGGGTIAPGAMCDMVRDRKFDNMDSVMAEAVVDAAGILARTEDAQLCDIRLDHAQYEQLTQMAAQTKSKFLIGYIRLMVDAENLKAICRILRLKKGEDFLGRVLHAGGNIPYEALLHESELADMTKIFGGGELHDAAQLAAGVISGDVPFGELDKLTANALVEYVKRAKYVPFGEEVVLYYLLSKMGEQAQIRTIIIGKTRGQSEEKISESLRQCYV